MISIRQILFSVTNSRGLTRTLGEIDVCRNSAGEVCYTSGNSAVIFKIRHRAETCALRCYTRPSANAELIYQDKLLRNELFIFNDTQNGQWCDVVLTHWVEGETLHQRIALANQAEFEELARAFAELAAKMVNDNEAHGDLKPENIVVEAQGRLTPIDFDASFLPQFAGQQSPELGTATFQHPTRTSADFDARLDDFAAALIFCALHALALDPTLRERHGVDDHLLIDPAHLPHDGALAEITTLFEHHGMAVHLRIAQLLRSPSLRLHRLGELLSYATHTNQQPNIKPLELFVDGGLWGYRTLDGKVVIAPLYDCGFDFSEGLAAVQLGKTWHFIDPTGCTVIHCHNAEAVKPFRNGVAKIVRHGLWSAIDRTGVEHLLEI